MRWIVYRALCCALDMQYTCIIATRQWGLKGEI
jgi:hypothetical protein